MDWNNIICLVVNSCCWSLPARECGLKWSVNYLQFHFPLSLPARECGLKYWHSPVIPKMQNVTPCTGVWIEIKLSDKEVQKFLSLPARECGLKSVCLYQQHCFQGHSLHGSVDWNFLPHALARALNVTPCTGVWIEMGMRYYKIWRTSKSLPARECGLKFGDCRLYPHCIQVTPCTGVWIEILKITFKTLNLGHSLHGSVDWNHRDIKFFNALFTSLPARECGLKSLPPHM